MTRFFCVNTLLVLKKFKLGPYGLKALLEIYIYFFNKTLNCYTKATSMLMMFANISYKVVPRTLTLK